MQPEKIKNKGKGRIFNNPILEALSRTHPLIIYSIYFPVIAYLLHYGHHVKQIGVRDEMVLFAGGVLCWSIFEYFAHRFLFHWEPRTMRARRFVYLVHGIHHEYPRDRGRLFMPVVPSITIATIFYAIMRLTMGWSCLAFFPGFLFGYLVYGSMHYAMHSFAPPRFLKALWRNHSYHHYQTPDKAFGVSSVLWDHIFGSVPGKRNHKQQKYS